MQPDKITKEWLHTAQQDLASAQFLMNMIPVPLEIIGYHCQQTIEKALKACLVSRDIDPNKTHDLVWLLRKVCIHYPSLESLLEVSSLLSEYAVHSRYPFFREIDPTETIDLVKKTEYAFIQIKEVLQ